MKLSNKFRHRNLDGKLRLILLFMEEKTYEKMCQNLYRIIKGIA